jgi:hypothetical protein
VAQSHLNDAVADIETADAGYTILQPELFPLV